MHACTIHVHVHMKSLELNFLVQNINKKNQRRKKYILIKALWVVEHDDRQIVSEQY